MPKRKTGSRSGAKSKTNKKEVKPLRREFAAFCFLFLAMFIVLSWYNSEDGKFTQLVFELFGGLLGKGIYPAAICYGLLAIRLFFHKGNPVTGAIISANVFPVAYSVMYQLHCETSAPITGDFSLKVQQLQLLGYKKETGGIIGGLLSEIFTGAFGKVATNLMLIIILAACVIVFFKGGIIKAFQKVKEHDFEPYKPQVIPQAAKKEHSKEETKPQPKEEPVKKEQKQKPEPKQPTKAQSTPRVAADVPLGNYKGEALSVMGQEYKPAKKQVIDIPMWENSVDKKNKTTEEKPAVSAAPPAQPVKELKPLPGVTEKRSSRSLDLMKNPNAKTEQVSKKELDSIKPLTDAELEELFGIKSENNKKSDTSRKKSMTSEELSKEIKEVSTEIGKREKEAVKNGEYTFPPIILLRQSDGTTGAKDYIATNRDRLCQALESFGIAPNITETINGPTVTRYDICLESGTKLSKITNLSGDLALALGVVSVRIAPVPDKYSTVGIEVPNKVTDMVYLRDVIDSNNFKNAASKISFAVGKDISGNCVVGNIGKLPHLLIAGTTGSGKSVCMNSLILSILYKATPNEVKFIMVDPKMVELGIYNDIPHLFAPVVTDPKKAAGALQWSVVEMLKRYRLFSEIGVRDLATYNRHCASNGEETLPQIVIVIDELADLMIAAAKDVEESICRIAQMGRAAGMHLVIATQRPSAEVITGLMKANIPSRIAFAVSSSLESRIILDQVGAEKLIGMGDMLYLPLGGGKPNRVQGTFVSDEEREGVINFIKEQSGEQTVNSELLEAMENKANETTEKGGKSKDKDSDEEPGSELAGDYDKMLPEAVRVSIDMKKISVSNLQRRVKLGYSRAARIMDQMEELGVVGPYNGAKPRDVIITLEEWTELAAKLGFKVDTLEFAEAQSEDGEYEE